MRRLVLLFLGLLSSTALSQGPLSLPETLADNASLRDVTFHDSQLGWAVGDHGAILRTVDGGQRWKRVRSPTDLPLQSVDFLDQLNGWAVGGALQPYTGRSVGVVLTTENGGRDWSLLDNTAVPRLRHIQMFDAKHGVAAGDGSELYPSGVYTTDDGGQHWLPVPGAQQQRWRSARFTRDRFGELAGVAVGLRGAVARVAGRRLELASSAGDRRGGYGVALLDSARSWTVGDGGSIRVTDDGGQSWGPPPTDPPEQLAQHFDWRTIAARGETIWIAGSPGSIVLCSRDAGITWQTSPTGGTAPIQSLCFVDEQHGWAVGDFGQIYATTDGGRSWNCQRGADRRAAVALLAVQPQALPVELLAHTAADEGYRTVVAAPLLPETGELANQASDRFSDAAVQAGVDATRLGWATPLPSGDEALPAEVLRQRLDRLTDGRSHELLTAEITKLILTYRPNVLVTPAADGSAADLLLQAAQEALRRAAETPPAETSLRPWSSVRLVSLREDNSSVLELSETRLGTGEFSAMLGVSPAEWAADARGVLATGYQPAPIAYRWRTIAGPPAPSRGKKSLLAGAPLAPGGDARRPTSTPSTENLDQLRRLAAKRRNMASLLHRTAGDPAWAGQVVNLTGGLSPAAGSTLLRQLAEGYREAGQAELAANTLYLLARRYPEAPLADASILWLVNYYASGERARADSLSQGANSRDADQPPATPAGDELQAADNAGVVDPAQRLERAAALVGFLEQARPDLFARPSVRFLEAAIQRGRGYGAEAEKTALVLSKRSIAAAWKRAAEAERWLSEPKGLPPEKPIANSRYTPRRPLLDGSFEEPAWRGAQEVLLATEPTADPTTTVRFAHDEQFLFLAIEAHADALPAVDHQTPRPRDADLTEQDRLQVRIDIDRDYATTFELTVDARGWTSDSLWGDRHWSPTWYVAAAAAEQTWRAELAIPLGELVDPERLARSAWAVSLRRTTPGQTPAQWPSQRVPADSPDAYGLLLFD